MNKELIDIKKDIIAHADDTNHKEVHNSNLYRNAYIEGAENAMEKANRVVFNKDQRIAELEKELQAAVELIPEEATPHQISDEDYELLQALKYVVEKGIAFIEPGRIGVSTVTRTNLVEKDLEEMVDVYRNASMQDNVTNQADNDYINRD